VDGLQGNIEEIKELKALIKQYMEEMQAMREYMREVPAMRQELQMTKERCERIGQGLHKFSMDLLKFKGV
jgi:prefoldin subunit 5